jgi:hypothetical protein
VVVPVPPLPYASALGSVRTPAVEIVAVAVPPKYEVPTALKSVDDACWMLVMYVVVVGAKKFPDTSQLFPKSWEFWT